jgi:hypothetical protein
LHVNKRERLAGLESHGGLAGDHLSHSVCHVYAIKMSSVQLVDELESLITLGSAVSDIYADRETWHVARHLCTWHTGYRKSANLTVGCTTLK